MSAMTKKEWMEYLEKTGDAAQREAWSEPQFECPRCGHCCQIQQAAQQAVEVMDAHMMRADTEEFYEAKEALRQALDMLNEIADDVYCDQKLEGVITAVRQALEKQWVGLKDEQVEDEWERITGHSIFGGDRSEGRAMYISPDEVIEFSRAIESKLKEKNHG